MRTWNSDGGTVPGIPRFIVLVLVLLTLFLGLALLLDWWPMLRGGYGHRWIYERPNAERLAGLLPGVIAITIYFVGLAVLRRHATVFFLTWCFLGSVAIPLALLAVRGEPWVLLFNRTISTQATSAFAVASTISDLRSTYAGWLDAMPGMLDPYPHMSTSSPVWPTLYYALAGLLARLPDLGVQLALPLIRLQCQNYAFLNLGPAWIASAWLGMLSPVWVGLTIIPMYALARRLGDSQAARLAAAWWPLVPSLALFAATLSSTYPVLSTATVLLFWITLHQPSLKRQHVLLALTGAATAALWLWNMSMAPLVLLFGLLTLIVWRQGPKGAYVRFWPLRVAVAFGLGMLAVSGLYSIVFGHTPVELFLTVMKVHTSLERPYWPWLLIHSWDVAMFAGLPAAGIALVGAFYLRPGAPRQLAMALGLTLALLVVTGSPRGETGRVWMFLMPLIVIIAAYCLVQLEVRSRRLLAGFQVLWLLMISLVILAVRTLDVASPPVYQQVAPPTMAAPLKPVSADFGDEMQLLGYQAQYQSTSHSLSLALHWQAVKAMWNPYYFSAVLVTPDGMVLPGQTWQPLATRFPTTCWRSRDQVVDHVDLALPESISPGNWWLSLSAFAYEEGQTPVPLPTHLSNGETDRQVGLGPIPVTVP